MQLSTIADVLYDALDADQDATVDLTATGLQKVMKSLAPFASTTQFLITVGGGFGYAICFDKLLSVLAIREFPCSTSAPTVFAVEQAALAALATDDELHIHIGDATAEFSAGRTNVTLVMLTLSSSVLRRMAGVFESGSQATTLPEAVWRMVSQCMPLLALSDYMDVKERQLDMYISTTDDGELVVLAADAHHQAVARERWKSEVVDAEVRLRLPNTALKYMQKLFAHDDGGKEIDGFGAGESLSVSSTDNGVFFVGSTTALYVPHTRENDALYDAPLKLSRAVEATQPKVSGSLSSKDVAAAYKLITTICTGVRSALHLTFDPQHTLTLRKTEQNSTSASRTIQCQMYEELDAPFEVKIDPRLVREVFSLTKNQEVNLRVYGPELRHMFVVELLDETESRTFMLHYMLGTKE